MAGATTTFGSVLRGIVSRVLSVLPATAPMVIYKTILKPRPMRAAAHFILRRIIPSSVSLPEGVLILNRDDPVVSGALALNSYETGSLACWRRLLRPESRVLDIGANIGLYSVVAAGGATRGRVVSVEPNTENATLLDASVKLNGFSNVSVVRAAVGATVGSADLHLDPNNKGQHSLVGFKGSEGVETVPVLPVDAIVERSGIGRVTLVKIDIEGWEAKALRGMLGTLRYDQPTVLLEFMPAWIRAAGDVPEDVLRLFEHLGYGLSIVDESTGEARPLGDVDAFMKRFTQRDDYVNLLAEPGRAMKVAPTRDDVSVSTTTERVGAN